MVIAESRYLAEDAAELVSVDIEPIPRSSPWTRRWPKAARWCTRSCRTTWPAWSRPRTTRAGRDHRERAARVHRDLRPAPLRGVPMETRGLVAEWDQWAEQLDVVFACQGVHVPRVFFSRLLGIPEDDVRVVMGDVGGAFGQKMFSAARGPGRRAGRRILGEPAGEVDRGPGREPDQRRARPRGVAGRSPRPPTRTACCWRPGPTTSRTWAPSRRRATARRRGLVGRMFPGPYRWSGPGSVALLRPGGVHEHLRALRLPGAVDDGDHRPGADGGRHRPAARHRPAGVPPPQRDQPRRAAVHQRHRRSRTTPSARPRRSSRRPS